MLVGAMAVGKSVVLDTATEEHAMPAVSDHILDRLRQWGGKAVPVGKEADNESYGCGAGLRRVMLTESKHS